MEHIELTETKVVLTIAEYVLKEEKANRLMIQVQEAKHEEKAATNQLTSLQNEIISYVQGEDDLDIIKWNESMVLTKKANSNNVTVLGNSSKRD